MARTHRLSQSDYFAAALEILGRGGHHNLTIGSLCDVLGVSKGSFYHHFGGWQGFVGGLLEHWERESTLNAMEMAARIDDPKLRRRVIARLIDTIPHDAEASIRVWSRSDPLVSEVQSRVDEERISMLAGLFAMKLSRTEARALAEMHHAILVSAQIAGRTVNVDRMRDSARVFTDLVVARYGAAVFGG
jgi:AcrR family transcriptional regulator